MKLLKKIILASLIILTLSTTAFAYIDPSVMTYVIQAVAGIVIATGAVIGIYYRKAKKKVTQTLNIDEEAKKEKEEDIVIFDEKKK